MKIQFCGAAKTVTGSCHYLENNKHKILIDCGMFQGFNDKEKNLLDFPFNPAEIEYVILTHAHIDHCGRLPLLLKRGFRGKIISTAATRDLTRILLADSAKVQKEDFERCERKGRQDCTPKMLYTEEEAEDVMYLFETYPYGTNVRLGEGLEIRMRDAGHILGSAIVEIWMENDHNRVRKIVFSGDLGQPGARIIKDPDFVREADYVIVESTYGNRLHKSKDETLMEFLSIIKEAQRSNGNLIVPTFAVERAQELLYELNLFVENKIVENLEVYFDSPLGSKATEIFRRYTELYDVDARRLLESGDEVFDFSGLNFIADFHDSKRLSAKNGIMIIAGSGMCTGGRVLYHLANNVGDANSHILFTGYQVKGTLGRAIVDGAPEVRINGKRYDVNIQVHTLGGFSAHSDQADLEYWLRGFGHYPKKVFTVHGDEEVIDLWSEYIRKNLMLETYVPELNEIVELD
ncbi:MBL fold metallo-hydrolase [Candidatus Dojkabacteria bacterium]|nr:MBL fold metallo-hydrolase [Candidatus Dojkabacteria bacterium]